MKKFKALFLILLVLLPALSLSACSSHINVSDMAIVQAVGIDKTEKGIKISVQYLDLAKSSGSTENLSENITSVATGEASSIGDAVSETSLSISSPIFFGQNKIIVLGSEYANDDIRDTLDYLLRGVDSRPDVLVAISEDKAEKVISNPERKARIPAENIYNLLKNGEKEGIGSTVTVNDLLGEYADKTTDFYLPVLKSYKDHVTVSGLSVFSENKNVATLNNDESFGFLVVNSNIQNATIVINDDRLGEVAVSINKCKNKNTVSVKNGEIFFSSRVKVKFALNDIEKGITNKVNPQDTERIERLLSNRIKAMCISSVKTCLDKKSDPFKIGRQLAKEDIALYNRVKDSWRDYLKNVTYTASAESELELISDNSVS
ncbi:MAG: Ger(x)C family spore germination protein [Eubacterium sp.]